MTKRMSDERKEKIRNRFAQIKGIAESERFTISSLIFELITFIDEYDAALRSERATVERLTKVAEQATTLTRLRLRPEREMLGRLYEAEFEWTLVGGAHPASADPELAAYLREKENT